MISSYYDKTANIERLTTVMEEVGSGEFVATNKKEFTSHLTSVSCHTQPLTDENNQDIPGGFGKDFLMFSDDVDIAEGDRVTIDTEEYRVVGTEALSFLNNPHRESRIRIFKS